MELSFYKVYSFSAKESLAIFTFSGCRLLVRQVSSSDEDTSGRNYVQKSVTSMSEVLSVSEYLELLRLKAGKTGSKGPVVLVTGSQSSGKNTLCRTLLNYACRL